MTYMTCEVCLERLPSSDVEYMFKIPDCIGSGEFLEDWEGLCCRLCAELTTIQKFQLYLATLRRKGLEAVHG